MIVLGLYSVEALAIPIVITKNLCNLIKSTFGYTGNYNKSVNLFNFSVSIQLIAIMIRRCLC